jgi:hypothetical protein
MFKGIEILIMLIYPYALETCQTIITYPKKYKIMRIFLKYNIVLKCACQKHC